MDPIILTLLIVFGVLATLLIVLFIVGKKAQKRQAEQQSQIEANKQTVSMLIIDKKKLKMKDSGLPQMVIDQTPKLMRRAKMPIVKAKIGPQIMSLVCDNAIYDSIPVKKEVKAVISGIYISEVKGLRGNIAVNPKKKKKKSKFKQFTEKMQEKAGAKPL